MDREKVISLYNKINKDRPLNMNEVTELMMEYCTSKGKRVEDVQKYIPLAAHLGVLSDNIMQILEEYSREFTLTKVIDKNNKVLLIY